MKVSPVLGALALSIGLAGSAGAAVTVLGDTSAEQCSQAAFKERADDVSMRYCTEAISNGVLDRRDLAGTYINRGVLWMVRHNYAMARGDFERAIQIDPALGEAWVNRGAVNIVDHRFQDGITDITKGLGLGTQEPAKAYYNRAVAYEGVDDEKSAYLDYQQALTLEPGWDLPRQELMRFTVTRRTSE
ncbi:MAG TPA: tetratricopeptide repeat protein [Caulobacteraceae bacterium]|nr:tetratricopeptide repeat protein [Caulobacteraceae bacterium]